MHVRHLGNLARERDAEHVEADPPRRVRVAAAGGEAGSRAGARGGEGRARVRDPARAGGALPGGAEPVRGDVTDPPTVRRAVEGCELVFNAMGLPEQWLSEPAEFDRVNARGTEAVVREAVAAGVP